MADRVVVTGGSGRIGRYLLRGLVPRHDVLNADIADSPDDTCEHVRCDVLDREQVAAAVAGARVVCHFGGLDYDTRAADEAFSEWLERALGKLPELRDPRLYENEPRASLFSSAKAATVLGWRLETTLAHLREAITADATTAS